MMNRGGKITNLPQQAKKAGFFGEEDGEASLYNYRPDAKDIITSTSMMTSASPSNQLSAFNFGQPPSGMSSMSIPGRGQQNNAALFQRNVTPTSIAGQNFPMNLQQQQQASPNRNPIFGSLGQRGVLNQINTSQAPGGLGAQVKRPNPITSGIMNSQVNTSTTGLSGFPRQSFMPFSDDANQPSLDLSEFPTLGNRSAPVNPVPAVRSYVGMVSKPAQEPAPEFQIQQEEFPALPSVQNPPTSAANDNSRKTPTSSPGLGSYEAALNRDNAKFPGDKTNNNQRRGIQTHPDGTVSNIPGGMVTDQFGMVGLLTFIRAGESDPNLVALAPGIDLTTLGLNLNSPDNLYTTFQSPWADAPCRPQDIDFHVPQEYLTNIFIRDKLAPIKLNRYGEDLLFFLYYMNGGDVLQLAAAAELYNREWRYHKEERVWITRVPGLEPQLKSNSFERGTYYFFDAQNWRKVAKEFRLEYDKLDERPHLPTAFHHNPNQPTVMSH